MNYPEPLNKLSPDQLDILDRYIEFVDFPANTTIFEIGAPGDCCYIIDEGIVFLDTPHSGSSPDDHENVLKQLKAGDLLGEMAILDRQLRSTRAFAHTNVKTRRIYISALEQMGQEHPLLLSSIYAALGQVASIKLRQATNRLAGFLFKQPHPMVDDMVDRAVKAQQSAAAWSEGHVDILLKAIAQTIYDNAESLATLSVAETGIGNLEDKIKKIQLASMGLYENLVGKTASGVLDDKSSSSITEVGAPVGVVFGLIPASSPVSIFIYKALICLKGRNALIVSPSFHAVNTVHRTGQLMQEVLASYDTPLEILQWVQKNHSRTTMTSFMGHKDVALVLASGGPTLVKAAYSSGTPAIGIGPGNAPAWVCNDADLPRAARQIVDSKSFDNGLMNGAEHNLVVDASVRASFIEALQSEGAAILTTEETRSSPHAPLDFDTNNLQSWLIGKDAAYIASQTGIERSYPIRLIVIPTEIISPENVYACEKLAPVLSLFDVVGEQQGIQKCRTLLEIDGLGHTAIIHTRSTALAERYAAAMPASRILVNAPGAQGSIGMDSSLPLSMMLGCGTYAGGITTENITYRNTINIKRLVYGS